MRLAFLLLCCVLLSEGAQAEVHKCRMPDGSLAFLDRPCPGEAKSLETPKLQPELPFAWRCGKDEPAPIESDAELVDLPPAQREALKGASYGLAYARVKMRWFFDKGRNVHVCADGASKGPTELVVSPEGRVWMNQDGKVKRIGAPDRQTRVAACSSRITSCFDPGVRSLDQCTYEAPICTTSEPVDGEPPCCEAACIARYRELRAQDMDPISALDRALFNNEACSGVKPLPSAN